MKQDIPIKMQAILLRNYNNNIVQAVKSLEIVEVDIPTFNKSQVLIKVDATTCNPSDLSFIQGSYGIKKELPTVPGFEGTGIVVDAGKDAHSQLLIGKRVSFYSQPKSYGAWAEYAIADVKSCVPVHSSISKEQAACMLVNPYTAYALLNIINERKSKAFVMNAASGQLSGMLQDLYRKDGVKIINIVRKKNQIETLKARGEEFVLSTSDDNFYDNFKDLTNKLEATTFIDAVSGEMSGKMLELMPPTSKLLLYGALSGENINNISAKDLIFYGKSIEGFNLMRWIADKSTNEITKITAEIQGKILKSEIKTNIYKKIEFKDISSNLIRYMLNMSAGKIIIQP